MLRRMTLVTIGAGHSLAQRSWASRPMIHHRQAARCAILYYHGVTAAQAGPFRRQMEWLSRHATVVPLAESVHATRNADEVEQVGRSRVCVTFDDAFANLLDHALPVLEKLGIPATIFAVSGNLGAMPRWELPPGHPDAKEPTMSAAELRELPASLIEIGSHTHTHSRLSRLSPRQVEAEFCVSKDELEQITAREVAALSIPFGDCPPDAEAVAADCGYQRLVTCVRRVVTTQSDPMRLGRFKVTPEDWPLEFRLKAVGAYDWIGRLRDRSAAHRSRYDRRNHDSGQGAQAANLHN